MAKLKATDVVLDGEAVAIDAQGRPDFQAVLGAGVRARLQALSGQDQGKVERPFGYVRQDFFLAGRFRNLDNLNAQLDRWLAEVANARVHATTRRVASEAFVEERPALKRRA